MKLNESNIKTELLAGLSTFFTMSYILILYPLLFAKGGVDFGASLTGTTLILVFATIFIALYANFPAVLAPGIGVGAFIIYSIVIMQEIPWQIALGFVFWVGFMVLVLSLFKIRQKILLNLPTSIKMAAIGGIGLFLVFVALINLNLLTPDPNTFFRFGIFNVAENLIAFFGLLLFIILYRFKISASFLISILACWILALFFGHASWKGFSALPHSIEPTWLKLEFIESLHPKYWSILLSLLLVTLFDSSASLTALANIGGFVDDKGAIKNIDRIVIPDGAMSMLGSLLGTGNLSFLLESSSGIKAGGKTALTALTAAFCSLLALFLFPLISSIPLFATTPVLIAIGFFMLQEVKGVRWRDWTEAIPALLILCTIPLTFSIYKGISIGFISYTILKIISRKWREVHPISWILSIIFMLHFLWTF